MSASRNVRLTAGVVLLAAVCRARRWDGICLVMASSSIPISASSLRVEMSRATGLRCFRYPESNQIIFEYTEGPLMAPLFADKITIDSVTGALTFDVREDSQTVTFRGTMTDDALVGTISDRPEPIRLPRIRDFGGKLVECR